ncbi:PTS sugar transporter subunit IIABC [Mycoplasmopsis cynos]|uniref:PTS sugar transporter subunit IIABC n=1 Tax=Mycoplasmopsis cynos TaxID=171284 RepID=A0ABD8AI57_9BACT|nr:PTS sugar transporter subunit IIABC [Mycoplasmopsis cynos]WAM05750.1 PTS sugar transporter subunit IIABC [Mycoplasmopsis cynos]WQQ12800.1 PTS sugar transporter subunit IIABC [Mycoplasmopsis cynos]WQQ14009.1 PTS sugar transporter subunit IIABC [Mycoplasmopsis cynos]WQQ19048.1 PTS sugar transporter subunit IIABC [Mycoplasmopsis cynos]WQQ19657.1 PTS sugar transporter subunit IIABC [Mycoplasmopsis cynos]
MINNKFKVIFLSIITFGLIWIKWRKKIEHKKNTIYQVDDLPFKISTLNSYLGVENYRVIDSKPSRLNIEIKDIAKVDLEKIKKLKGVSGIFVKSSTISIILGVYTNSVYQALNNNKRG